jgi:hypothetical protein
MEWTAVHYFRIPFEDTLRKSIPVSEGAMSLCIGQKTRTIPVTLWYSCKMT